MTRLAVFGATGYTGSHVVAEAVNRGLDVTALVRRANADLPEGVTTVIGDATDASARAEALAGADAVLIALSPKGPLVNEFRDLYKSIVDEAPEDARILVMGGWSSLKGPGGQRQVYQWGNDPQLRPYRALAEVADDLEARTDGRAWTYLTPPNAYGAQVPPQRVTGDYRLGGETPLQPHPGQEYTWISGEDMAKALVDLLTSREHIGEMVNVAA